MYQLTKDLFRIPMKAEEVLCSTVYESEALKEFTEEPVKSPKIEEVYGHLKFPKAPTDRPYVYASFITTIDGKIDPSSVSARHLVEIRYIRRYYGGSHRNGYESDAGSVHEKRDF